MKYTPKAGEIVVVKNIPNCDFCEDGTPGPYDFGTRMGPWGHGCEQHWKLYRASESLGTGAGQLWITEDQVAPRQVQSGTDEEREDYASLADEMNDPDVDPWNEGDWDERAVANAKRYAGQNNLPWPPQTGDFDRWYEAQHSS